MLYRCPHPLQTDSNDRSDEVSYCKLFKNIPGYRNAQAEFRKGSKGNEMTSSDESPLTARKQN